MWKPVTIWTPLPREIAGCAKPQVWFSLVGQVAGGFFTHIHMLAYSIHTSCVLRRCVCSGCFFQEVVLVSENKLYLK